MSYFEAKHRTGHARTGTPPELQDAPTPQGDPRAKNPPPRPPLFLNNVQ